MNKLKNRPAQISLSLVFGLALFCGSATAANQQLGSERVVENLDQSKTFINPWVQSDSGQLKISRGAVGTCLLLGMNNYLKGHVIWSSGLGKATRISDKGVIKGEESAHFIKSITCISDAPYRLKITAESIDSNPDSSVTVKNPQIHRGALQYKIYSGHDGACSLLGYNATVKNSMVWSEQEEMGVILGTDGKFYSKDSGSFLLGFSCMNDPDKKQVSPDAWLFR